LKTVGFGDGLVLRLVAAESMILSLAGGFLGCGLAFLIFRKLNFTAGGMFPNFRVLPETLAAGLLLSLLMGLLSGLVPAIHAGRLQIAGALRKVA
jgi:putative ABC transport system permease protein